jgi:hypothetical protein
MTYADLQTDAERDIWRAEMLALGGRSEKKDGTMSKQTEQPEASREVRELAPDGWGYDWRGRLVDLNCMRPGEDGRPPIFVSKLKKVQS